MPDLRPALYWSPSGLRYLSWSMVVAISECTGSATGLLLRIFFLRSRSQEHGRWRCNMEEETDATPRTTRAVAMIIHGHTNTESKWMVWLDCLQFDGSVRVRVAVQSHERTAARRSAPRCSGRRDS